MRDAEGKWVSTNELTSKNFSGTTLAGSSGGYDGEWQWTPEGNGYRLTADLNSHANAWGRLKAPSVLWEYDPDELTLVGIGKNTSSTEVSYAVPDYDWQWDSRYNEFSYYLAPSAGFTDYRTYIFEQKAPEEPTAPGKPGDDVVQNLLSAAVKVECTNTAASHASKTYGLLADSYTIGDVTGDGTNGYTVPVTVQASKYVAQYSTDMSAAHTLDPNTQQAETITLKWNDNSWMVDSSTPVTFTVKCSSEPTPPEPGYAYTINGFTKERVTGGEPNDAVFELDKLTINYDESIELAEDESVTLLYKLTITGDAGAAYTVKDEGAQLVGWLAAEKPSVTISGEITTLSGMIPADGETYFYVAKTFTAADIQNGKLVNAATITGATSDDGLGAAIDPDGDNEYTVTAETEATGPETGDEKVSKPGLEKWIVLEDGTEVDADTAAAGDEVDFKLESNVPEDLLNYLEPDPADPPQVTVNTIEPNSGTYPLTFHDNMDEAFENPTNFVVKVGDTVLTEGQYTLVTAGLTDGCDFEVTVDLAALYKDGIIGEDDLGVTPVTVTYTATLKEGTTAGDYYNTAWVSYPNSETEQDKVKVETFKIDVFKYDQADEKGLAGAEFALYDETAIDQDGNLIEGATPVLEGIVSGEDGHVVIDGLDAGKYALVETKAPDNYVKSDTPLMLTIEAGIEPNVVNVKFANSKIPHTGGMGTTLFTIGGVVLLAAAGTLFVASRRKQQHS
ncbi:MAG TPA: isopeptide-forming domain-containing fimbrial protein [Candidatus Anaeromassilibacillus stercoravium]|nr:isopeptide-forming domain-containing fimbrial protein [Candidatus Anaeromassilibacillus stercoravium]